MTSKRHRPGPPAGNATLMPVDQPTATTIRCLMVHRNVLCRNGTRPIIIEHLADIVGGDALPARPSLCCGTYIPGQCPSDVDRRETAMLETTSPPGLIFHFRLTRPRIRKMSLPQEWKSSIFWRIPLATVGAAGPDSSACVMATYNGERYIRQSIDRSCRKALPISS